MSITLRSLTIIKPFIFILVLAETILQVVSQNALDINLGEIKEGKVGQIGSYTYYKFSVNSTVINQKQAVQIVLKPLGEEINFSDPDMYVSSTTEKPTEADHEWFSESFGMDIITIEPDELKEKNIKTLYIGVTCENGNCPFKLQVQYETEIELPVNNQVAMRLNKDQDTIFTLKFNKKIRSPEINMLQVSVWSPNFAKYEVLMQKNKGISASESIKLQPAWIGSSSILLKDAELCDECEYHILIYPKSDNALFLINSDIGTDFFEFKYGTMAFAIAPSFHSVCHRKAIMQTDSKIIINAMLFSGRGKLAFDVSEVPIENFDKAKYSVDLKNEYVIAINKEDLGIEKGHLMFCFQSYYYTSSFSLNVYDEKDASYQQLNNILYNGVRTPGFLPEGGTTKYSMIDTEKNTDITITYDVRKGSPKLYGYICKNQCTITKKFIEKNKGDFFKAELLIPSTNTTESNNNDKDSKSDDDEDDDEDNTNSIKNTYKITIPSNYNTCELTQSSFNCLPIVIVDCEGDEECIYTIQPKYGHSIIQLVNAQHHHSAINYGSKDNYYFNISDDVDRITVIINKLVGNADLIMTKDTMPTEDNWLWSSAQEVFTPDVITLKKKDDKDSLKGDYYLSVIAESYSSYSVLYYTSTKVNKNNSTDDNVPDIPNNQHVDTKHLGIELKNGLTSRGFLAEDEDFRVFELTKKNNTDDVKFFLTSLKENLLLYVYNKKDFMEKYTNSTEHGIVFKDFQWTSDHHMKEVVIHSDDENYIKEGTYYAIIARPTHDKFSNKHSNTTFFITGVHSAAAIVLQDGLPQIDTLGDKVGLESQDYLVFMYKGQNETVSINSIHGKVQLDIYGYNKNSTLKCSSFCKSLVSYSEYCEGSQSCAIMLVVSLRDNSKSARFSIALKNGNSNTPQQLIPGVVKTDSVYEGDNHYYRYYVNDKTSTYAYFTFQEGVVDVYARLVTQSSKNTKFPESADEEGLINTQYSYRGGKAIPLSDATNKECFLDPSNPSANNSLDCVLLITVKGVFSFNQDKTIYYNIDYSGAVNYISTDTPIYGEVSYTNLDFFTFYIPEGVDYFTISLSHVSSGSTLLINKKNEYPVGDADWVIGDWRPQIFEIKKNDRVFIDNTDLSFSGNYYGAVYANNYTTYNLYINTQPQKIEEVDDYSVSRCTVSKGESCYYTYFYSVYEVFDDFIYNKNQVNYKDMILVSHLDYIYGDAIIYAKIVNEDLDDYDKVIPSAKDYDFSSKDQNSRDFMKIIVDKQDPRITPYKSDPKTESYTSPIVIFSVYCINDCDVKFRLKEIRSNYNYLDSTRENLIYAPKDSEAYIQYYVYSWDEEGKEIEIDQDLQFSLFEGSASFTIKSYDKFEDIPIKKDSNATSTDATEQERDKGKLLEMFTLNSSTDHWISHIPKTLNKKIIYMKLKTSKEAVGLAIKPKQAVPIESLSFNSINLISSDKPLKETQTKLLYFQNHMKYQNVTLNILSDYENTLISVYGKYYEVEINDKKDKTKLNDSMHEEDFPSIKNSEFKLENANSGISYLSIPNNNRDYTKNKIYVLLRVEIKTNTTSSKNKDLFDSNTPIIKVNLEKYEKKDDPVKVYSVEISNNERFTDVLSENEVKTYKMSKMISSDDYLIVHIDRCDSSDLKFKVNDNIIYNNSTDNGNVDFTIDSRDSRYLIKIPAPKDSYFLSIWMDTTNKRKVTKDEIEAFYMIQFKYNEQKKIGNYPSLWKTSPILTYDIEDKQLTIYFNSPDTADSYVKNKIKYTLYMTNDIYAYQKYNSLCYLNIANFHTTFFDVLSGSYNFELKEYGKYYIGLTASLNGDIFVYSPIEVVTAKSEQGVSWPIISKFI